MLHTAVEACLFYRKVGIRKLRKGYPRIYADLWGVSRVYVVRMLQRVYPRTYAGLCRRNRVYGVLNSKCKLWFKRSEMGMSEFFRHSFKGCSRHRFRGSSLKVS